MTPEQIAKMQAGRRAADIPEGLCQRLSEYFARPDTPAAGSPTGLAMTALLRQAPALDFEEARRRVNQIGPSAYAIPWVVRQALKVEREAA